MNTKSDENKSRECIQLRVTTEEKLAIKKEAAKVGLSISKYIKMKLGL